MQRMAVEEEGGGVRVENRRRGEGEEGRGE